MNFIIRLQRRTTYVDAAYCYRPRSVVCRLSVCLSVCHSCEPCKNGWTDRDAVWVEDYINLRFTYLLTRERGGPLQSIAVSCAITAAPMRCLWDLVSVGPKKACIRWSAHWRHLANTTEPSMCSDDAACCQIAFTTCANVILALTFTKLLQFTNVNHRSAFTILLYRIHGYRVLVSK